MREVPGIRIVRRSTTIYDCMEMYPLLVNIQIIIDLQTLSICEHNYHIIKTDYCRGYNRPNTLLLEYI